jgi:hypothetical protein
MAISIPPNEGGMVYSLDRASLAGRKQMELRARLEPLEERDMADENARYRFRITETTKVHGGKLYKAEVADKDSSFTRIIEQNVFTLEGAVAACDSYRQNLLAKLVIYNLKDPS